MHVSFKKTPAQIRDEIALLDDRWPWWGVLAGDLCSVPDATMFVESDLLTQMALGLIENHSGAYQSLTSPVWTYGWLPRSNHQRCWLLKPSERKLALNADLVASLRLTNRQVRVQLHSGMIHAEQGLSNIFERMAQPRRPRGATNQQLRLMRT